MNWCVVPLITMGEVLITLMRERTMTMNNIYVHGVHGESIRDLNLKEVKENRKIQEDSEVGKRKAMGAHSKI